MQQDKPEWPSKVLEESISKYYRPYRSYDAKKAEELMDDPASAFEDHTIRGG
ncbi:MAG: hypothetical protein RTV72_16930 [Candidatus Thorarchaeota archaeon]